jgi:leukotriene-A4 hydrolase
MCVTVRADKHTLANIDAIECSSIDLQLTADFDRQVLHGYVEIEAKVLKPHTTEFILDTRALFIRKATIDNVEVLKKQIDHPIFGTALHLALPSTLQEAAAENTHTKDGSTSESKSTFTARIYYETTDETSAIQWLTKEQTADKTHPYLFTQCQAVHARSLLPCQDCPMAKTIYKAAITVPSWATCLMSAVQSADPKTTSTLSMSKHPHPSPDPTTSTSSSSSSATNSTFYFEQRVAVPSYLIAIVIGRLDSREIGPRSRVWSEPSQVDAVAYEFGETEAFLQHAEAIMDQPYVWGRYDLVSLPPSFPFGGMENPCLTFVTPTLLAGDRSLADVVAHEIAHSWTGNLITNHTWEHFWLNEGWTMWLQRKIVARMKRKQPDTQEQAGSSSSVSSTSSSSIGEDTLFFDFDASIGWNALQDSIDHYGADHEFTKLVPQLDACDPDDAFSSVPYEKGFQLLYYLSSLVGESPFERFAQAYCARFKFHTVTSDDFKAFFLNHFRPQNDDNDDVFHGHHDQSAQATLPRALSSIPWDTWFYAPGMPPKPAFDTTLATASMDLAQRWVDANANVQNATQISNNNSIVMLQTRFHKHDICHWSSSQVVLMLETIIELCTAMSQCLDAAVLDLMMDLYQFAATKNAEIRFRFYTLALRSKYVPILPYVKVFLFEQGRMKFVRPLFRDLVKSSIPGGPVLAKHLFDQNKNMYHPICRKMLAKDLSCLE